MQVMLASTGIHVGIYTNVQNIHYTSRKWSRVWQSMRAKHTLNRLASSLACKMFASFDCPYAPMLLYLHTTTLNKLLYLP
jgi:hypothetical protein